MSDLTARIMEVVARLKGEAPPAPPAPAPGPHVADCPAGEAADPPPSPDPAELTRVLGLPLSQLDRVLRVAVPWLDVPLWFVPDEQDAEALVASSEATRGAVWTRRELLDLLSVPGLTTAGARRVAEAKLAVDGEVVAVRSRIARDGQQLPRLEEPTP